MARKVEVQLVGDSRSLERAFGRAQTRSHGLGRALTALNLAIAGGIVIGLEKSAKAAIEAEASQARLQQSFKNSHIDARLYEASLQRVEKRSRALGFTDDEVRDSLGSLITASGDYQHALRALSTAQDLSRFKHVDLTDATKMLTMAMTGSQRAAKQLGIVVIPTTAHVDALKRAHIDLTTQAGRATLAEAKLQDKMATGAAVIDEVTKKTHGQAKAFSETGSGAIAKFHAEVRHLEEELGQGLIPVISVGATALTRLFSGIESHVPQIREEFGGLVHVGGEVGRVLGQLALSPIGTALIAGSFAALELYAALNRARKAMIAFSLAADANPFILVASIVGGAFAFGFLLASRNAGLAAQEFEHVKRALSDLRSELDKNRQSHLDLEAAQIRLRAANLGVANALSQRSQIESSAGRHSLAFRNADLAVTEALHERRQAQQDLNQATGRASDSNRRLAGDHARLGSAIVALNKRYRDLTAATIDDTRAKNSNKISNQAMAAGLARVNINFRSDLISSYAARMRQLASDAAKVAPQLAKAARVAAALAASLNRIPSRKEIDIFIRTFEVGRQHTVGGRVIGRQHGGFVPGPGGQAVPILAHAGEIILNPDQQQALGGPRYLSQLFGFHGERGPGSSMAAGGKVGKKHHRAPRLPAAIREAEARAAGTYGLADDIAAYTREERWVDQQLHRHDLTGSERESLRVRRIRVVNRLKSLRRRQAQRRKAPTIDYSQIPARILYKIAKARESGDLYALRAALTEAIYYLKGRLSFIPKLTFAQKTALYDALTSYEQELKDVNDQIAGGDTGGETTADQQAIIDQLRAQLGVAQGSAALANAFVATGVFAGSGPGGASAPGAGGGGGGQTIIFNSVVPATEEQAQQVAALTAQGGAGQPYRTSSQAPTGY